MGQDLGGACAVRRLLPMTLVWRVLLPALVLLAVPVIGLAQEKRPAGNSAATQEILDLREKIRTAVAAKDRAVLEALYADNYTHLRDSGRIDLKGDRITLLLSGETTIETAPEEGLTVEVYGPGAAAATGVSPIPDPARKKPAPFRWVVVYAKDQGSWKVALSQASRVTRGR
jgi:hypothetical protein